MSKENPLNKSIHQKINIPNVNSGLSASGKRARIQTDWGFIKWTKKKLFFVSLALGLPYSIAIISSIVTQLYLATVILTGLGIMVIVLFLIVRWIDRQDNF